MHFWKKERQNSDKVDYILNFEFFSTIIIFIYITLFYFLNQELEDT